MIPIRLTIEGLYSYQKRQTIDFTHLTEAGLFGIFGAVGSGKSTILEAITYALYGETERLNARDKRAYNMMNLKSNRIFIEFDFQNHEEKIFRATREFKRNSKNFEDVKAANSNFYERINEVWIPMQHTDAQQIIGLNYQNFKRTIIIPQGQFREFLELGAKDRTTMMKEIFHLQSFDLWSKANDLSSQNSSKLDVLSGKLGLFEEINEEIIKEKQAVLNHKIEKYNHELVLFQKADKEFDVLKKVKEDFLQAQQIRGQLDQLKSEENHFAKREKTLLRFEKTVQIFKNLIEQCKNSEQKLEKIEKTFSEEKIVENRLSDVLKAQNLAFEKAEKAQENLPKLQTEVSDWQRILVSRQLTKEISALELRAENGRTEVEKSKKNTTDLHAEILDLQKNIDRLKAEKTDTSLLLEAEKWYIQQKQLNKDLEENQQNLDETKGKANDLIEEKKSYPTNWRTLYPENQKTLKNQLSALLLEKQNSLVVQKLEDFANHLHNGEPCPLCGATEHPQLLSAEDISEKIKSFDQPIKDCETKLENLQKDINFLELLTIKESNIHEQLSGFEDKIKSLQASILAHRQQFKWSLFSPENENDFQEKKNKSLQKELEIQTLENDLKSKAEKLETLRNSTQKYEAKLKEFDDKILALNARKAQETAGIELLKDDKIYEHLSDEDLQKKKEFTEKEAAEISENYRNSQQAILKTRPEHAAKVALVQQLKKQHSELQEDCKSLTQELNHKILVQQFKNADEVLAVLNQNLEVENERAAIQKFRETLAVLSHQLEDLAKKLEGKTYDEEIFTQKEKEHQDLKEKIEETRAENAVLSSEIDRLQAQFSAKANLLHEQKLLQNRAENLKIMLNLFKAGGFVEYVSSIFLRQLCDHANLRFHRMTRNQLSLQLNENHDFEIIDYLNEGRSRSVKTLSGGQAFQVSLSLALALAESVQTSAQADKNFFFIDEGFGTQDSEAVNLVFETLTSLQKEQRIVGIISHVDALKEKIPVSLNVIKDEEKGSQIGISLN